MTKLFYLVTTFEKAKAYGDRNQLANFTGYNVRNDAIRGALQLGQQSLIATSDSIPLVGKLEMPEEQVGIPQRVSPSVLTQFGYDPTLPSEVVQMYRDHFDHNHLERVSLIKWNMMQEDIKVKEDSVYRLKDLFVHASTYLQDHKPFLETVRFDDEKQECFEIARAVLDELIVFEGLKKNYGFSLGEEILHPRIMFVLLDYYTTLYDAIEQLNSDRNDTLEGFDPKGSNKTLEARRVAFREQLFINCADAAERSKDLEYLKEVVKKRIPRPGRTVGVFHDPGGMLPEGTDLPISDEAARKLYGKAKEIIANGNEIQKIVDRPHIRDAKEAERILMEGKGPRLDLGGLLGLIGEG